jgi:CheY-like chemotaxis protein
MTIEKLKEEKVWLKIVVKDTGYGIKEKDQADIFRDFVQVDMVKNQGIEGTGLGLAITKRLCQVMGGDISLESKYGEGSSFTVTIPQGIDSFLPFAAVEKPEGKRVLVFERRSVYAKSVCWSLENMRVPHTLTQDFDSFAKALRQGNWFFVFSGYGLYDKIEPIMDDVFPGNKKPPLALMVEWGVETYIPNVRFVSLPIQSLSIANVLNGRKDTLNEYDTFGPQDMIRFTLPNARILIVDDIFTNLKVAEGLLAPYQVMVDVCLSGTEAIDLVKNNNYDLVFMDHMMPEMDGIETVEHIRAWEAQQEQSGIIRFAVPIVALTANAVSGTRKMFIENGFNDFLAKPIDISKLDEILANWIPREKRAMGTSHLAVDAFSSLDIPGIDIKKGIAMTGGSQERYRQILSLLRKDVEKRIPLLQGIPENLSLFIIQVHALKSVLGSVGASKLSTLAAELEAAANEQNMEFIAKELPAFAESLIKLNASLLAWENNNPMDTFS